MNFMINIKYEKNELFDPIFEKDQNTLIPMFNMHVRVDFGEE